MGLDTVELIVDTEKLLNVEITDEEAVVCYTVGDLAKLVYLKKLLIQKIKIFFMNYIIKLNLFY